MKKAFAEDMKKEVKKYYVNHDTWNTPNFAFKDQDITMSIFGYCDLSHKNIIYGIVKRLSMKAEDGIADRMNKGQDFYFAKDHMKYKHTLPLLVKRRGIGWYEPTFDDLDDDQKKRFDHHKKAMHFSQRRSNRIQDMKEIQESLREINKK